MSETELKEMSVQELEKMLATRKEAQRKEREKERADYEKDRDKKIAEIMGEASRLQEQIAFFKQKCHNIMEEQAATLEAYGAIRGNSKGGFSITNSEGNLRVTRRRDTMPSWDERATKGVELVHEFLHTFVRKRDKKIYEVLMSFIEKNKNGDLEYARVMTLMQHENKWADPKWVEGLALIKEGYMVTMRAYGYDFKKLDGGGHWETIGLNFSSL